MRCSSRVNSLEIPSEPEGNGCRVGNFDGAVLWDRDMVQDCLGKATVAESARSHPKNLAPGQSLKFEGHSLHLARSAASVSLQVTPFNARSLSFARAMVAEKTLTRTFQRVLSGWMRYMIMQSSSWR